MEEAVVRTAAIQSEWPSAPAEERSAFREEGSKRAPGAIRPAPMAPLGTAKQTLKSSGPKADQHEYPNY